MEKLSDKYLGLNLSEQKDQMGKRQLSRFLGEASVLDETLVGRTYSIMLANASTTAAKVLCLFPGALNTIAQILGKTGKTVDGIIGIDTIADLTVNADDLRFFFDFVRKNPTRIPEIQLQVTNAAQINNPLEVFALSPVGSGGSVPINPRTYQRPNDANTGMVSLQNLPLQLDDQTAVIYKINPGETVTLNLFIGAVRNEAAILDQAAKALLYSA